MTAFDTIHDQAQPAILLGHVAAVLKKGGTLSLSQNGAGLGAMWGQEQAKEMLAAAGLIGTEVHRLDEDPVDCCYVARKA